MIDLSPSITLGPAGVFRLGPAIAAALGSQHAYDEHPLGTITQRVEAHPDTADLAWRADLHKLTIFIRGSDGFADWVGKYGNLRIRRDSLAVGDDVPGARVHSAWRISERNLRAMICEAIRLLPMRDKDRVIEVDIGGHSRGAVLSALLAFHLVTALSARGISAKIGNVHLFGCPRIGNAEWAAAYNRAVPNTWRVVNVCDLVPMTPPVWHGWRHVGRLVYIARDNTLREGSGAYAFSLWDRLFAALNDLGRPGLKLKRAHHVTEYVDALTHAKEV